MALVLVVDDKEMLRDSVGATLSRAGLEVIVADGGQAAIQLVAARRPDCIVTDLKMPGMTGIELLAEIRAIDEEIPVLLMTAFATVETAVKAIKLGAFDYLTKPFEGDALIIAVKRAVEHARLLKENALLKAGLANGAINANSSNAAPGKPLLRGIDRLIGQSPAMRRCKEQVLAVAESAGTVLIVGESGTGKEVVANAIHDLSPRRNNAFLGLNCAALSESLLESELFGHERGAFTGADKLRKGRFELADGGTLLLDEISEVPTRVQAKLLRVLQERLFERVGASLAIGCDVRIIATSNQDLPRAIAKGLFRQDLFFRLNVLPIHVPPLRDRSEDIAELAAHFLATCAARDGRPAPTLSHDALTVMRAYPWPGNVRELHNICERASVLCKGDTIEAGMIVSWLSAGSTLTLGMGSTPAAFAGSLPSSLAEVKVSPAYAPPGLEGSDAATLVGSAIGQSPAGGVNGYSNGYSNSYANGYANGHANGHTNGQDINPGEGVVAVRDRLLEDIEREAIVFALHRFGGHRQKTAQTLGIGVRTLGLKLKKWKSEKLVDASL